MAELPSIYVIQASDASQHTGKLQEILQGLKAENRIESITTLGAEGDLSSVTGTVREGDLILVVLTHQLDTLRGRIETELKALKAERPEIRVGEIIVDNVPYENEFITFPADLRHIRDREDMDVVWSGIEQSLKDMFPAMEAPEPTPSMVPKYLKMAGVVLGVVLAFFIFKGLMFQNPGGPDVRPVPAEVLLHIEKARESLNTALALETIAPAPSRQLEAVREQLAAGRIERIIAAGSERAFERELAMLKEVETEMANELQSREASMKRLEVLIRSGRFEETEREALMHRLDAFRQGVARAKRSILPVREAVTALENARHIINA